MDPNNSSDGSSDKTSTSIDLGDDLLNEKTKDLLDDDDGEVLDLDQHQAAPEDLLKSARILINEGILEDAKKILHKVLRGDTRNLVARKMLQELHQAELRMIFSEHPNRARVQESRTQQKKSSEQILDELDQLLGILDEERVWMDYMREDQAMGSFLTNLDHQLSGTTDREKIDLGIAFLEMAMAPVALHLFQQVMKSSTEFGIAATQLAALAMIQSGSPFEATLLLEPFVQDADRSNQEKIDAFYLMGRAYEKLGRRAEALNAYSVVRSVQEYYRDTEIRLKELQK